MCFLYKRTNIMKDEFNSICHPRKQFLLKLKHEDCTTYQKNAWNLDIWRIKKVLKV